MRYLTSIIFLVCSAWLTYPGPSLPYLFSDLSFNVSDFSLLSSSSAFSSCFRKILFYSFTLLMNNSCLSSLNYLSMYLPFLRDYLLIYSFCLCAFLHSSSTWWYCSSSWDIFWLECWIVFFNSAFCIYFFLLASSSFKQSEWMSSIIFLFFFAYYSDFSLIIWLSIYFFSMSIFSMLFIFNWSSYFFLHQQKNTYIHWLISWIFIIAHWFCGLESVILSSQHRFSILCQAVDGITYLCLALPIWSYQFGNVRCLVAV